MATPTHEYTTSTVRGDVETKFVSDDIVPYTYVNRLTPPIGTTFFHK